METAALNHVNLKPYQPSLLEQIHSLAQANTKNWMAEFSSLSGPQREARVRWHLICKHAVQREQRKQPVTLRSVSDAKILPLANGSSFLSGMVASGILWSVEVGGVGPNGRPGMRYGLTEKGRLFIERWTTWCRTTGFSAAESGK